jgi:hypothetical protein
MKMEITTKYFKMTLKMKEAFISLEIILKSHKFFEKASQQFEKP